MLTAEKEINCCCNPTTKEGEHRNTSYAFVCVPLSVEFVVAIIARLLKRFTSFCCGYLELLTTRDNILLHSNQLAKKQLNLIILYIINTKSFLNASYSF